MLVLTRRVGESIRIGDDIELSVLVGTCGKVRLGVEAPETVPVYTEGDYNKILDRNNKRSIYDCPKEKIKND